jgi:hypothetical protein
MDNRSRNLGPKGSPMSRKIHASAADFPWQELWKLHQLAEMVAVGYDGLA